MTPEERQLLRETADLTKENNKILRGIRRSNRFSAFFRFIYWALIIGSAIGAYYYIQPFIDPLMKGFTSIQQNIQSVKDATNKLPSLPSWMTTKQ